MAHVLLLLTALLVTPLAVRCAEAQEARFGAAANPTGQPIGGGAG